MFNVRKSSVIHIIKFFFQLELLKEFPTGYRKPKKMELERRARRISVRTNNRWCRRDAKSWAKVLIIHLYFSTIYFYCLV